MAEMERTKERERPPIKDNPYEAVLRQRAELKERNLKGPVVIRSEDREMFQARQGKLRFYMDPVSFKDKTITIVVGFTPGGTPDVISRAAAEQMARRLPGRPTVIVRNAPGAEGVVALNSVVTQTRPDGLTLVTGAGGHFDPLYYRNSRAVYDPEKLIYVGGIASTGSSLLMSKAALSRLYDRNAAPVVMGASNNIRTTMWAVILGTEILRWNVKWVFGYPGTNDLKLALARRDRHDHDFGPGAHQDGDRHRKVRDVLPNRHPVDREPRAAPGARRSASVYRPHQGPGHRSADPGSRRLLDEPHPGRGLARTRSVDAGTDRRGPPPGVP